MDTRTVIAAAIAAAMTSLTISLFAADQPSASTTPKSEPIYGYRMMTGQERDHYRDKMRTAKSTEERQALRDEHHKLIEQRAKERGVTLPEPRGSRASGPGGRGEGMGPGRGPGAGMGQGGGKGPGYGSGPQK